MAHDGARRFEPRPLPLDQKALNNLPGLHRDMRPVFSYARQGISSGRLGPFKGLSIRTWIWRRKNVRPPVPDQEDPTSNVAMASDVNIFRLGGTQDRPVLEVSGNLSPPDGENGCVSGGLCSSPGAARGHVGGAG
jgi:hypothetical protein